MDTQRDRIIDTRISCLGTGQVLCYDVQGREVPCAKTGQDGEFCKGRHSSSERFKTAEDVVVDSLTGLTWLRNANPAEFPQDWNEAWDLVRTMNAAATHGYTDWRIPTRRELRSLVSYQTRNPSLPEGHPFTDVFLGWYWTSTTAAINTEYSWYIHMAGARMFYGKKRESYFVWPVRGLDVTVLPWTGQTRCYDMDGNEIPCNGTGQDADIRPGLAWPSPRFTFHGAGIVDHLTGLEWFSTGDLLGHATNWQGALDAVKRLNRETPVDIPWRLPNINELESLVDCNRHNPALPADFSPPNIRNEYWSSTTSTFEPSWAWALYLHKGAIGVGHKAGPHFHVWPVRDTTT